MARILRRLERDRQRLDHRKRGLCIDDGRLRSAWACGPAMARVAHTPVDMSDAELRAALDRHWAASNAGDDAGEGDIYRDDVELEYPQSGERFKGRRNVLESRGHNPAGRRFEVRRTLGSGDLWVIEYVIFYDGRPVPTVSIMEFRDRKVAHETQYFADPFEAPAWRERWRETKR